MKTKCSLLPCPNPWCDPTYTIEEGFDPRPGFLSRTDFGKETVCVVCPVCHLEGPYRETKKEAEEAWNTRKVKHPTCATCELVSVCYKSLCVKETLANQIPNRVTVDGALEWCSSHSVLHGGSKTITNTEPKKDTKH